MMLPGAFLTAYVPLGSVDDSGNDDGGAPVEAPARYEVVRSGATIAWFFSHAMPGEQPLIPPQVVSAQIRKL